MSFSWCIYKKEKKRNNKTAIFIGGGVFKDSVRNYNFPTNWPNLFLLMLQFTTYYWCPFPRYCQGLWTFNIIFITSSRISWSPKINSRVFNKNANCCFDFGGIFGLFSLKDPNFVLAPLLNSPFYKVLPLQYSELIPIFQYKNALCPSPLSIPHHN